jgi:molybdenum cofactor biosynthesis protein A
MPDSLNHITDKFGRKHDYLRISLTERCNLRCFYCMPEEGIALRERAEFMSNEEVLQIAGEFVKLGVRKIRLTGGEPLVRKGAGDIILALSKLPIEELAITTNGVLVHKFIDVFKEAGLKSINISLDSLNAKKQEFISRRNYFDRIMENIQLLLDEGFHVKINAVVMKHINDNEITDFIEWTRNVPVDVRFIEFMPFDGNNWNWEKKVGMKEIMETVYAKFTKESVLPIAVKPNDTAKNFRVEGFAGSFGVISPVTNPFCDSCNRIRLTADGKIKNCLFSNEETDLLKAVRNDMEIAPMILDTIWRKKEHRAGIDSFESKTKEWTNRSMVAIGG